MNLLSLPSGTLRTRILVVDDITRNLQVVGTMLRQAGYEITLTTSGAQALDRVRAQPPDLILLDLMMPEMDGFDFLEELRKHDHWRGIPVIVVTAKELTEEDRRRLNGSVNKILQKGGYGSEELLREIHELVITSLNARQTHSLESTHG